MAYSIDLRQRVLRAVDDGDSVAEAAERFEVSETAIYRWLKQSAAGVLGPLKPGARPVPTKLTPADLELLRVTVAIEPGITLAALAERLAARGTRVVESTVSRALLKLGLHLKKSLYQPASNAGPMSYRVARRSAVPRCSRDASV